MKLILRLPIILFLAIATSHAFPQKISIQSGDRVEGSGGIRASKTGDVITLGIKNVPLPSLGTLRSYSGEIDSSYIFQVNTSDWTSSFKYDPHDVTTPDDGILTIVNGKRRLKRVLDTYTLNVKWFGAVGDFDVKTQTGTDNTTAFQNAFNFLASNKDIVNFKIFIPAGKYWIRNTLSTPNGASWFTIEGEDKRATVLYWGKRGNGGDFIKLVNCQHGVLRNFSLVGQNGSSGQPDRMINIHRDANLKGTFGMIGDVTLENIYCNGALGKFKDGLAFTCNGINGSAADANNEQATILNCYFELASRYGIAFQHENSLWHRIIGGRVSGYSACIVNHREDGSTGGSFQLMNTTVMGLTDTSRIFKLVAAQYPISIINTQSEGGSVLLDAKGATVNFTNCAWKLSNAISENIDISNTSRVAFQNCLFLAAYGTNFIVRDASSFLFIQGGTGNVSRISYAGRVSIDGYGGGFSAAYLKNLGGGIAKVGRIMNDNNAFFTQMSSTTSTINADDGAFFELQPSAPTVYNTISNGYPGKEITVFVGNTRVQFGPPLSPIGSMMSPPVGTVIKFTKIGDAFGGGWISDVNANSFVKNKYVFAQTEDVTVKNTTQETSLFGVGSGSNVIPANTLRVGQTILIKGVASISTGNAAAGLSVRFGASTASMNSNLTIEKSLSNANVEVEFTGTVRKIGPSGSIQSVGWMSVNGVKYYIGNSTLNLNTSAPQTFDLRIKWTTASAANTMTIKILTIEIN